MTIRALLNAWRDYVCSRPEPVVKDWLERFDWDLPERDLPPNDLYATRHIPDCLSYAGELESGLVQIFIEHMDKVHWAQMWDPDDFGRYFTDNYCHLQLIGPEGHFASDTIAGGIVMYGPHTHYPNHWHLAEEIYIPLTGNGLWSRDNGDYVLRDAGEFIFHEENVPHAMKCEDTPMLALWIWHGGDLQAKADH
ncbi:MAG: dimethylsulfonioproprionate lyase family protein [Pseudomonadota bacterium]